MTPTLGQLLTQYENLAVSLAATSSGTGFLALQVEQLDRINRDLRERLELHTQPTFKQRPGRRSR